MKGQQLRLPLAPARQPSREQPVIERLRAVLERQGINWQYRCSSGSVLLRPLLASRCGWQPMCGYFGCGDLVFERTAYFDRPPLEREERQAWSEWRESVWRKSLHELWGAP